MMLLLLLLLLLRELIVRGIHVNNLRLPHHLLLLNTGLHRRPLLLHLLLLLPLHL